MHRPIAACLMAAAAVAVLAAGDFTQTLRARYPKGIPWHIEFLAADGKTLGVLDALITSERGDSCLGEMSEGVRVDYVGKEAISPSLFLGSHGVARISGDSIKIDLTGGICDAYLIMSGTVAADGSSTGELYRFGMRGSNDVGTYRATVRSRSR